MKEIKAIIQPHRLTKVMEALHAVPHFPGATISDCRGQGRGKGEGGHYVATEQTITFEKMVRLELICTDALCDDLVDVLHKAAHTGNPGDGVIVVADLIRVLRVRTGQEQNGAV